MGKMHFNCYKALEGVTIAAVCDADEKRLNASSGVAGNISGTENATDLSGINLYTDYDRMLKEEKLDAVSITLPTFIHPDFTCKALAAGVNVLCEKPMALNVADCDRMIDAANQSGKILQIGQCIRFWPEYAKTKELIDSGKYGKTIALSLRRLTASPTWSSENWLMNEQRSGGVELDLHIHDTDYVQFLFGMPKAVSCFGAKKSNGGLAHIVSQFLYDDNKVVTAEADWVMTSSFGFEMSFNLMLESATVVFDCNRKPAFKVCPAEGEAFTPEVESGDGYSREIAHFVERLKTHTGTTIVPLESSRNSIRLVEAQKESIRTGKAVAL